ncbi:MAG: aminopeptidase P family N-terminal domain-containing protein, partial [Pseudomonadota bacterium]
MTESRHIHFSRAEFADRLARTRAAMADRGLDALLCFAQESLYWLTGHDTFGFCFFQCL